VGQICSTSSPRHNLNQCRTLVQQSVKAGVKVLFLPEASDYIARSPAESVQLAQTTEESEFVRGIRTSARENGLEIQVGIHEPILTDQTSSRDSGKIRNSLLWINSQGDVVQKYEKLHLYDVNIEGGPVAEESKYVSQG
jgi:deaminated glutathione amidase